MFRNLRNRNIFNFLPGRRRSFNPSETLGTSGTPVWDGYPYDILEDKPQSNLQKGRTYRNILKNRTIVAASVRYILDLAAKQKWSFTPTDADPTEEFAEAAERILTEDPDTPWDHVVRRAATFRFFGFSVQEYTLKKVDGIFTIADIQDRPQHTIDRWDLDENDKIQGIIQQSPITLRDHYIPRGKVLYLGEDTLTDNPEGYGLFSHIVDAAERLGALENLERLGFDGDLRGIPVGYAPLSDLRKQHRENPKLFSAEEIRKRLKSLKTYLENYAQGKRKGLMLDSKTYTADDGTDRPSNVRMYDMELKEMNSSSLTDLNTAIMRLDREIARIFGTEQLLLGEGTAGSFALSKDKTQATFLIIDGMLREIAARVRSDLLKPVFLRNGWPEEAIPEIAVEALRFQDPEQMAAVLRDMAAAGAMIMPGDKAPNEVRETLGLSPQEDEAFALDALGRVPTTTDTDEDEPMEDEEDGEENDRQGN